MRRFISFLAALGVGVLIAGVAKAQDLDYGKFERLFGESVTDSATGKPERVSDTPVLMDVITAEDIQHSGARDIPTLLRRLAGVDVANSSAGMQDVGLGGYIQSLNGRVMVLLNGRQVYFDGFGAIFWSTLPVELDEIRQIEVVKGPQSALYGFNAADGVINIVTFDPVDDDLNAVRSRVGSHAMRDFAATTTQSLGDGAGVRLTAADDHQHDYGMVLRTPNYTAYSKDPNRRSVSLDSGVTLADGSRLGVEASHTDVSDRDVVQDVFADVRIVTDSVKGSYTAETDIGRVSATAYYTEVHLPWVQSQALPVFSVDDRTAVGQVSDLFKIGPADSFRLGVEARHDKASAGSVADGTLSGDLFAGSSMWEHAFSPEVSMVNALRYDFFKLGRSGTPALADIYTNADFDRSVEGTSVNSALIDKVTDLDTLRLSFARGLKLPSLLNFGEFAQFQPQYRLQYPFRSYYFGNPDLRPSTVYDYQAGWDRRITELDATARINAFHEMTMSHLGAPITVLNTSGLPSVDFTSINTTGSISNGLQLELRRKAKEGWSWGGNYTYERLH
jgi:iron complex outermembrane receptor protein